MLQKRLKVGTGLIFTLVCLTLFALSNVVYADSVDGVDAVSSEEGSVMESTTASEVSLPVQEDLTEEVLPEESVEETTERETEIIEQEINDQVDEPVSAEEGNNPDGELLETDSHNEGWKSENGSWYYYRNGKKLVNGWYVLKDFNGKEFKERLNIHGQAIDQIFEENGEFYYSQAGPLKGYYTGWLKANGFWYYYQPTGARATGWQLIKGEWYYFRDTGTMLEDTWAWVPIKDGKKYVWKYFNANGENVLQYFHSGGYRWLSQPGSQDGYVEGWYEMNDYTYYFREGSGTAAYGWQFIDDSWYYIRQSGTRIDGGWGFVPLINNKGAAWKYFEDNGSNLEMHYHENGYSYLSTAGPYEGYVRGWNTDEFGITSFYRMGSGSRTYGWQFIDGYWRYFKDSGALMKNAEFYIGDVKYYGDQDGVVWQNDKIITSKDLHYSSDEAVSYDRVSITMLDDGSYRYEYVNPITGLTTEFDPDSNTFLNGELLILDISSYQKPLQMDLDEISKQIDGVILRVGFTGYGTGSSLYYDDHFEYYYEEFTKRGVPIGGYWYSCADTQAEAVREANFMINKLNGKKFALPIYWDTEDAYHQQPLNATELTKVGQAFLDTLEQAGYYGGLYASSSWLRNELRMDEMDTEVWVAHYGVSKPSYTGDYGMWQYTSRGKLAGHDGELDLNLMYKNYMRIIQLLGLNGFHLPL